MMPGAPGAGAARVTVALGPGGWVDGRVRLRLPAGHPALSGGACRLTLDPGLQLVAVPPYQWMGERDVAVSGVDPGPADLTLRFKGRLRGGESPYHGYTGPSDWFWPAGIGWFPYPGAVNTTVRVLSPPEWVALLPGRPAAGADTRKWRVPAGVPPTLLLGRWDLRPFAGPDGLLAADPEKGPPPDLVRAVAANLVARYGPWPYGGVHVAQVAGVPLEGLSLPGLVLLNPDRMPAGGGEERYVAGLLAHELAHQWWGNALPVSTPEDVWLMESLAEWERMQYLSAAFGPAAGQAVLAEGLGLYLAATRLVGPLCLRQASALRARHPVAFDGLAYGMGLLLLCVLSRASGHRAFAAALRRLAAGHGGPAGHGSRNALSLAALCRALDPAGDGARWWHLSQRLLDQQGLPPLSGWAGMARDRLQTICAQFLARFQGESSALEGESG